MSSNVKLRRFQFKRAELLDEGPDGAVVKKGFLDYFMTAKDIINLPSNAREGMSAEDIVKATTAWTKFKEAKKAFDALTEAEKKDKTGEVFLDSECYSLLKSKTEAYRWGMAHEAITDFIKYVRELPEENLEVKSPDSKA